MRSLVLLVVTTTVVSGSRAIAPGFAADFRSFGDSSIYQQQRLPHREQARSFREPEAPRRLQFFREESVGDYRQPFPGQEEPKNSRREARGGFKDDSRPYDQRNRGASEDELRNFDVDSRAFRDEGRTYKDEVRGFTEERRFGDDPRTVHDGPGYFREERPYREEIRHFRNELRPFRDESRSFRDEVRQFEGPRNFRDEYRPFREEPRHFRDERPFKEESGSYGNQPRPFRDERPFGEEPRPFKDELLFTEESRSLAEAQHRFNKEHQHRQPLSFGGHSNYLKFGNHGLGFASVPSAILPLDDDAPQRASGITVSTAATPQSPEFRTSAARATSSPSESEDSKSQNSATLPPDVVSTPSQSTSGSHRKNENLFGGGSTSSASTAATVSTSVGPNPTPTVVFGSGSASISSTSMGITGAVRGTGIQPTNAPSTDSVHDSKPPISVVGTPSSYFPSEDTTEVPAALLNYIFKYRMPDDAKTGYTFRPSESFNNVQAVPLVHHQQTANYAVLPEFKIPEASAIRQPIGAIDFLSSARLPKLSYVNGNQPALTLGTSYPTEGIPSVSYPRNFVQLDRGSQFSHLGQVNFPHIGQNGHFPQFGQLAPSNHVTRLGEYGQFGQVDQTRSNPFGQGGLQLELGGFGGIDYSALSGNSKGSRVSQPLGLDIGKVGLSLQEPARAPVPTFTKISFGQPLW